MYESLDEDPYNRLVLYDDGNVDVVLDNVYLASGIWKLTFLTGLRLDFVWIDRAIDKGIETIGFGFWKALSTSWLSDGHNWFCLKVSLWCPPNLEMKTQTN